MRTCKASEASAFSQAVRTLLRLRTAKKREVGWSSLLRTLLNHMFYGPRGLQTAGVILTLLGEAKICYARLGAILADGESLAEAFQWKGAAGIKACFRHYNCLMLASDLAGRAPGFVEIDCSDPHLFKECSPAALEKNVKAICAARKKWERGELSKAALDDLEKVVGLSVTDDGLLADDRLRQDVQKAFTYDWVHCALSNGTFSVELGLLVGSGKEGLSWASLQACFERDWRFPKARSRKGRATWKVFRYAASSNAEKLKSTCTELLNAYSIVRHFVNVCLEHGDAAWQDRLASFNACCEVIDCLLACKRQATGASGQTLTNRLQAHMTAHKKAWGSDNVLPKHHWLFDVPGQVSRDGGVLLDMFITERLHLTCKGIADKFKNNDSFDPHVLRMKSWTQRSSAAERGRLSTMDLLGPTEQERFGDAAVEVAVRFNYMGMEYHTGDMFINITTGAVGRAVSFMALHQGSAVFFVVVQTFAFVSRKARHSTVWRELGADSLSVWNVRETKLADAWYHSGDFLVLVV